MDTSLVFPGERTDDLQRDGLVVLQKPDRFCFGIDAVLLSSFVSVRKGDRVIDLGTGCGVIPLLLSARQRQAEYLGVEIQEDMADMASRSIRLNGREDCIRILCADLRRQEELPWRNETDVVCCNPPYGKAGQGKMNPDRALSIARHEVCCTLQDILDCACSRLRPGGHFFMIFRAVRLAETIAAMEEHRLTVKRLRMIHPFAGAEAAMFLTEGVRDGGEETRVEAPLVIYREPGIYTQEILEIYGREEG